MYNVKIDTDPYDTQPVQQPVRPNHVVPMNDHGNAIEMVRLLTKSPIYLCTYLLIIGFY